MHFPTELLLLLHGVIKSPYKTSTRLLTIASFFFISTCQKQRSYYLPNNESKLWLYMQLGRWAVFFFFFLRKKCISRDYYDMKASGVETIVSSSFTIFFSYSSRFSTSFVLITIWTCFSLRLIHRKIDTDFVMKVVIIYKSEGSTWLILFLNSYLW